MFDSIEIKNYRALNDLRVSHLGRINLVAGENNSGKTALLEALFLLCGAGNPELTINAHVSRGTEATAPSVVPEIAWKPMFRALDMARPVAIAGNHQSLGIMELKIESTQPDTVELSRSRVGDTGNISVPESTNAGELSLTFKQGTGEAITRKIIQTRDGFRVKGPAKQPPFFGVFLSSRIVNTQEDAIRLGQLRKRKQGNLVLEALRIVEPRLQSVEDNSASGIPVIWGDIGLPELVPLSVMGEGMARIARVILAISASPEGIVLVDEIENGLHHSVLGKVWKAIQEAAIQFNTQVFASTHSFECVEAAHKSLSEELVAFHRLEVHEEKALCVSYGASEIKAAIAHGLEVR